MLSQKMLDELKKGHEEKTKNIKELIRQIADEKLEDIPDEYGINSMIYITQEEIDKLLEDDKNGKS